jgi:CxxC motif-containing protein (DUF1111 family)
MSSSALTGKSFPLEERWLAHKLLILLAFASRVPRKLFLFLKKLIGRGTRRVVQHTGASLILVSALFGCGGGGSSDGGGSGESPPPSTFSGTLSSTTAEELRMAGGETTSSDRTTLALENPSPNLNGSEDALHARGDREFESLFVGSGSINGGLGPTFNHNSCNGCHVRNGRGQPEFGGEGKGSPAVVKVSESDGPEEFPGGPRQSLAFGSQIQDHSIFGGEPEASLSVSWQEQRGSFSDGSSYSLRVPRISISSAKGRDEGSLALSFRTAPPVFGLGLLEAIPTESILRLADPDDSNNDGISGRPNTVWNFETKKADIGRFGRKASRVNLLQQTAGAYEEDMGIDTPLLSTSPEISKAQVEATSFYTATLAVPGAVTADSSVSKEGFTLFKTLGCEGCHHSRFTTGKGQTAAVSGQVIYPFTDMLLHDMGEGLADGRSDFAASGREWRTTPLWGLGVTATILGERQTYLHDGRARTIEEAVLWHGGEAEASKQRYTALPKEERDALLAFLRSL